MQEEHMVQLRGVNLGGWLVLEKWMTPSIFTGIAGPDEYSLCSELGPEAGDILRIHRDNFITETDFAWIADRGLNAVRLPVGYWALDTNRDQTPFVGCIEYVDRAFEWATRHGLMVVLDLHGAPGSQNGQDHSGRAGKIRWQKGDHIEHTLNVLERLCQRYAGVPSLRAVELLNEPSWSLGKQRLSEYYQKGYDIVRQHVGDDVAVVMPDAYKPKRWKHVLTDEPYTNVWLDVHLYQIYGNRDRARSVKEQVAYALKRVELIDKLQYTHPVIIGEWSAALPATTLSELDDTERDVAHRTYADVQLFAQYDALGWFYWNYKTETGGPWSFRDCVARGWLPNEF